MSTPAEPQAPSHFHNTADGLPKQDDETLEDVQVYVEALLNYRELLAEEPIGEDELPENSEIVDEGSKGTILHEYQDIKEPSI